MKPKKVKKNIYDISHDIKYDISYFNMRPKIRLEVVFLMASGAHTATTDQFIFMALVAPGDKTEW